MVNSILICQIMKVRACVGCWPLAFPRWWFVEKQWNHRHNQIHIYYHSHCDVFPSITVLLPPLNGEGYVFISVGLCVCVCVCLFVFCLPVTILRENAWTDFRKIFRIGPTWNTQHPGIYWGSLFHPWLDGFTFLEIFATEVFALGVLLVHTAVALDNKRWQWSYMYHQRKPESVSICMSHFLSLWLI